MTQEEIRKEYIKYILELVDESDIICESLHEYQDELLHCSNNCQNLCEDCIERLIKRRLENRKPIDYCSQCGKPIYEDDDYFYFDDIGCFCEKCQKYINNYSKNN